MDFDELCEKDGEKYSGEAVTCKKHQGMYSKECSLCLEGCCGHRENVIKELRTRVAELTQERDIARDCICTCPKGKLAELAFDNDELKKRVASLEKEKKDTFEWIHGQVKGLEQCQNLGEQIGWMTVEIQRLQNRLSTLEKEKRTVEENAINVITAPCLDCQELKTSLSTLETYSNAMEKELRGKIADWRADAVKHAQEVLELRAKLSTLLKASEGMEKALDRMDKEWNDFNKIESGHQCEAKIRLQAVSNRAKQALADFRAVKEHNEIKGGGK